MTNRRGDEGNFAPLAMTLPRSCVWPPSGLLNVSHAMSFADVLPRENWPKFNRPVGFRPDQRMAFQLKFRVHLLFPRHTGVVPNGKLGRKRVKAWPHLGSEQIMYEVATKKK